jgi:hypothetical protein
VRRREFITLLGSAAATTGVRNILFARDPTPPSDALEGRLADIIAAYDSQGNHRTEHPRTTHRPNGLPNKYGRRVPSQRSSILRIR